ncbi:MAG: electron transport complex subunit RsxG [Pseudomonadota bacterium]|nr:electron transport complex subunit RsxG [Pseudomonadota bacterium]
MPDVTLLASLRSALILAGFAILGTALVAVIFELTHERIEANERAVLLRNLNEILPASGYDNDVAAQPIELVDESLGALQGSPAVAYVAWLGEKPTGVVITVTTPDGYNGPIRMLVGIRENGSLEGVRVVSHRETPGLGDLIETRQTDWILGFRDRSIGDPPVQRWAVKRDGGDFDQFTGATISPRAVVNAVKRTLIYFGEYREELFTAPPKAPTDPGKGE